MWPGILVPIIMFFGLTVFVAGWISGQALKNIEKKR